MWMDPYCAFQRFMDVFRCPQSQLRRNEKKKLIEIYQPQPTEMAFLTGTEENLSPERAARLVKEAKNVNVCCNLHLRVCILMKSAINGKMLLQRPKGLIYCYDTRCMISNLDDLLVVLRPICR